MPHIHTAIRLISCAIAVAAICLSNVSTFAVPLDAADPPNIVFILADDLGYGDLGCYNPHSKIPTPNLDKLAAEGIRFTDAHSPSAVCTPTRYGLLTGRYAWRTSLKRGVLWGESPFLIEPNRLTVASLLKRAGYHTACVGKWHLGLGQDEKTDYFKPLSPNPLDAGFDRFFGIPASLDMAPYVFVQNDRAVEPPTETIAASRLRREGGAGFWREGGIAPGFRHIDVMPKITDEAVSYIEGRAADSQGVPFFLYFPLTAPHTPWLPTAEFEGKSAAGYYGDFVVEVDAAVGRLVETLEQLNLADDTLLIVTSDNGAHWLESDIAQFDHRSNGHLRGQKADIWEGGHRVPYIARWPDRIAKRTTSDQTICHVDLLATVAEIVGVELPADAGEDSYSILPALLGTVGDAPIREATVHHSGNGVFAIRQGRWKLVLGLGSGGFTAPITVDPATLDPGDPVGQLYNLADDPAESDNLYNAEPEVVRRLSDLLSQYARDGRSRFSDRP